jgi:hypothetical protein
MYMVKYILILSHRFLLDFMSVSENVTLHIYQIFWNFTTYINLILKNTANF